MAKKYEFNELTSREDHPRAADVALQSIMNTLSEEGYGVKRIEASYEQLEDKLLVFAEGADDKTPESAAIATLTSNVIHPTKSYVTVSIRNGTDPHVEEVISKVLDIYHAQVVKQRE